MVSADRNCTSSRANGAAWIFAIAAASSLAAQAEQRIALAADAPFLSVLGPVAGTFVVNLVLGLLVALTVPWFEVVAPRRKVIAAATAVVGIATGAAILFDTGGHFELFPVVLLGIAASLARFLSVLGDVSYVGLLPHQERVRWYFLKYFGAGAAGLLFLCMTLLSRHLLGRAAVIRDLLGGGIAIVLLAALLWRILPDFGERDAPSPRASWSTAVVDTFDELRSSSALWPTVAVFALLPLPTAALREAATLMLLQSTLDGGLELANADVGTILGLWSAFASFAGLFGGWFALRRISPERLVRAAIILATLGVLAWWALAISRPTSLLWVTTLACIDALCRGFSSVVILLLAMQTFGTLRHYATGYVWLVALAELLNAVARPLAHWFTGKLGTPVAIHVFAFAGLIVAAVCTAMWSGRLRRVQAIANGLRNAH
jgi:hypothetical protein